MLNISVVWSERYRKYEGFVNGKIVSRRATESQVREYISAKFGVQTGGSPKVAAPVSFSSGSSVRDEILAKVKETVDKVNTIWPDLLKNRPVNVAWLHTGRAAGRAQGDHTVKFHLPLFSQGDNRKHIHQTVNHELAHIVVARLYPECFMRQVYFTRTGRRMSRRSVEAHGREWQDVMRRMGCRPDVTHSMDCSSFKRRVVLVRYRYSCKCGAEHLLTKSKHFWVHRNPKSIYCKKTREYLTPQQYLGPKAIQR